MVLLSKTFPLRLSGRPGLYFLFGCVVWGHSPASTSSLRLRGDLKLSSLASWIVRPLWQLRDLVPNKSSITYWQALLLQECILNYVDTLEIIRQIEADAGLRAQLRAILLGDDFLDMPRVVLMLAEGQRRLDGDVSQLKEDVSQLKEDVSQLKEDVSQLKEDVSQLKEGQRRLEGDVSQLKGSDLERQFMERSQLYLSSLVYQMKAVPGVPVPIELLERLDSKAPLDPTEWQRMRQTDFMADARRKPSGERVTVVVEVSATLHPDDVTRVADSATVFSRRGLNCLAVAAGRDLGGPNVAALASERAVELVSLG